MVCKFPLMFLHQSLSCGFALPHDDFGIEIHLHDSGLESFMGRNPTPNRPRILTRKPDSSLRSLKHQTFLVMLRELLERRQREGYVPNDYDNTAEHLFREFMKDFLWKNDYLRNFKPAPYKAKCLNIKWSLTKEDFQVLENDIIKVLEDDGSEYMVLLCFDTLRSIYPQFSLKYLFNTCFGGSSKLMKARKNVMTPFQQRLVETKDYDSFRSILNMYPSLAYTECPNGYTLIGHAVREKDEKKIEILKECLGVSTSIEEYMTPFDIGKKDKKKIEILKGCLGDSTSIEEYMTPFDIGKLSLSFFEDHDERIKSWINSQDTIVKNRTLGMMAAKGLGVWVEYLLSRDADPLFKLPNGISLLKHIKQKFENHCLCHQKIISLMEEHVKKSRATS